MDVCLVWNCDVEMDLCKTFLFGGNLNLALFTQ